jgi:cation diffusion facilitator CzcD-associated flavoprotein CzcO
MDDGATVGGIWSQERIYPSLYAQISYPLFQYSFYPMKNEGISPDGFISGQTIHNYLASFAEDHGLMRRIRLRTRVSQVGRNASGRGWVVETQSGERPIECDKLIYATGGNSSPIRPAWPRENFDTPVIHSLEVPRISPRLRVMRSSERPWWERRNHRTTPPTNCSRLARRWTG